MSLRRRSSIYDTRIAGLYDLGETIGKGHFAVVKAAKHVFTGEKVAVKVIDKTKIDSASKQHLLQEVRCMKLVQHPHIVRLYEVIDTQTRLFLVLELGDYDMFDYIMKQGERGVSESLAQRYFCQIVNAIDYCHQLHVVHRDLKPENVVFMEKFQTVKLTDFGFSNLFVPGQHLDTSCGSLAYSAPEILLGDSYDAPAVDIWSLGVILYMMMCGRLPFQEANDSETLTKILDCAYVLPSHLSEGCRQVIRSMLIRDPAKRVTMVQLKQMPWVNARERDASAPLPLVHRASVSEDVHDQIIEHMVVGNIADADQICRAVESDDYSYITATYYLLLERYLRKERYEQVRKHSAIRQDSKCGSQSNLDSLSLSPRTNARLECAAVAEQPQAASDAADAATSPTTNKNKLWRQRTCSMVHEESESDLSVHLIASRSASPVRGTSPRTGSGGYVGRRASPVFADVFERVSRASSAGRSSAAGSRSPSPPPLPAARFRSLPLVVTGRKLPSISSSPHLVGICEETEAGDTLGACAVTSSVASASRSRTLSALRLVGRRHVGVSPDVNKRYECRSRRSTSCSSSEASDDEERRLSLIRTRFCHGNDENRRGNGTDDDSDHGGASVARRHSDVACAVSMTPSSSTPNARAPAGDAGVAAVQSSTSTARLTPVGRHQSVTAGLAERLSPIKENMTGHLPVGKRSPRPHRRRNDSQPVDAQKLASKLEKLMLAPIREIPQYFAEQKSFSAHGLWQRLFKTRSCESIADVASVAAEAIQPKEVSQCKTTRQQQHRRKKKPAECSALLACHERQAASNIILNLSVCACSCAKKRR